MEKIIYYSVLVLRVLSRLVQVFGLFTVPILLLLMLDCRLNDTCSDTLSSS